MLFEILGTFVGFFVGKGKRGSRQLRMLGIILGISFFLGLIGGFLHHMITDIQIRNLITFVIIPIPVNMALADWQVTSGLFFNALFIAMLSVVFTFVYFLIGKFAHWLISKRGL